MYQAYGRCSFGYAAWLRLSTSAERCYEVVKDLAVLSLRKGLFGFRIAVVL